jgi:glycosyltransferase involved in cell wall biosynthesis
VVVPAHNEEELLDSCLAALDAACAGLTVRVVVVLDRCRDGSAEVCRSRGVDAIEIDAGSVGRARAAGVEHLLAATPEPERFWLAHTDADTRVGAQWLTDQLELAAAGADAVLGLVHLPGPAHVRHHRHQSAYLARVRDAWSHGHVHGANLGLSGRAYWAAGGFPPLAAHEDRHLVNRLDRRPDITVVRSSRLWVETSDRILGRCPAGFSADLAGYLELA